jgi:hypothetical protein
MSDNLSKLLENMTPEMLEQLANLASEKKQEKQPAPQPAQTQNIAGSVPVTALEHTNKFDPNKFSSMFKEDEEFDKRTPIKPVHDTRPSKMIQMTCAGCGKTETKHKKYLQKVTDVNNPRNSETEYRCNNCVTTKR